MGRTFRKNYGERERVVQERGKEPSRTHQSFKDEQDVNLILKKYTKTGILPQSSGKIGEYGDFSDPVDYQAALNVGARAREQFEALPAKARKRFNNDPREFLEFMTDKENANEAVKLGLATKKPEEKKVEKLPPVPEAVIPPKA